MLVYQHRDGLARDIANRFLAGTGIEIVDVSLDTLTPTRVVFDSLSLRLAGGSRITVSGLEAPIEFPGLTPGYVAIGTIDVRASGEAGDPTPLAPLVRNYVALPERFPSTALTVERLSLPGLPPASNLVWTSAEGFQRLHLAMSGFVVDADTERVDAETHTVTLRVQADGAAALEADIVVIDRMGEVQVNAYGTAITRPWVAALGAAGLLPETIDSIEGTLFGMASIRPDSEQVGRLAVTLTFAGDEALRVATTLGNGLDLDVRLPVGRPSEFRWEWPANRWSLRAPESRWSTDLPGLESLPVQLTDLDCSDEIRCDVNVAVGPGTLQQDNLSVDRVMMTLPLALRPGETTSVEFSREPSVFLTGLRVGEVSVGALNTLGLDDARLDIGEDGVSVILGRVSLNLSTIAARDLHLSALALELTDARLGGDGLRTEFRTAARAGTLSWRDYALRIPGTSGRVEWRDNAVTASATVSDREESLAAGLDLEYRVDEQAGRLDLREARLDFSRRSLSAWLGDTGADLDVMAGTLTASGNLALGEAQTGTTLDVNLDGLAGSYADVAATGIDGTIHVRLDESGPRLANAVLDAGLVDVGVPLENVDFRFSQPAAGRVDVGALTMDLLGGRLAADPFTYDFDAATNRVFFRPTGIQLPLMAALAGFESLDIEGRLGGGIPVTIKNGKILINEGRLDNEPPGGIIRFNADTAAAAAANAGIDIASRALRNFHFDSLSSDVNYDENGNLTLGMRLSGINPDMDPDQPIILNLNVENNVPELLRSLQAVRSIEDIIGRETARQ